MTAPSPLRRAYARYEWIPVTVGHSGAGVWHLRGPADLYLKVAAPSPHPDSGFSLVDEARRATWLAGTGLPAPRVVDHGTIDDDHTYLVTTAVPGRSAAEDWPAERCPAVVDALADIARSLHALPVADCPFDRSLAVTVPHARRAVERGLVGDDLDEERRGWSPAQLLSTLDSTRPVDEDLVVCHGDLCLPNVILDPDTTAVTGLVDLGRLGRADRYTDLALLTRSLGGPLNPQYGPTYGRRLLTRYGVAPVDEARLAFYRLLDEFF